MNLKDIKIGAPLIFNSSIYGRTAVHVTAVHNEIIHFTIDGGEASRQVRDFPELSDGKYFAIASRLEKRPAKPPKAEVVTKLHKAFKPMPETVENTIREVPGVGKVAIITDDQPKTTAQRAKRRLSFLKALDAADAIRGQFNWPQPGSPTKRIPTPPALQKHIIKGGKVETF